LTRVVIKLHLSPNYKIIPMLTKCCFASFLLVSLSSTAQYKNDNVLYKTVDPEDLCTALQKNKGYLLLDVRSKGEYEDTSAFTSLNIGHLKGAQNISVRELDKRLGEIDGPKDRPIYVYCSHSQRSRRASKLLADSGYTNVFNINAGMTSLYYSNAGKKECIKSLVETKNQYRMIGANNLCEKLSGNKKIFLLDVRPDSAFRHITTDPKLNAYGAIRNTVNIPLAKLETNLSLVPKDKEVIITDLFGGDAAKAAVLLQAQGYKNVSVLIEGIERLLSADPKDVACRQQWYQSPVSYQVMGTSEFGRYTLSNKDYLLLDIRSEEAFANKHKDSFRNVGHLQNAINIPSAEISNRINELEKYKGKDVFVYGFSSDVDSYAAANTLSKLGYKVTVINGGLFNFRWSAANQKDKDYLRQMVVDVPEANL